MRPVLLTGLPATARRGHEPCMQMPGKLYICVSGICVYVAAAACRADLQPLPPLLLLLLSQPTHADPDAVP